MVEELLNEEISLLDIVQYIKKSLWFIALCVFFASFISVMAVLVADKEIYKATSSVIMSKEAARIFYDDEYTKSDIDLYQQVGNTYIKIAESNSVIDGVIELLSHSNEVDKIYTRDELRKLLHANYLSGTLVIELIATSEGDDNVAALANAYTESFIAVANTYLPVSALQVLDVAEFLDKPIRVSIVKQALLGAIVGGIISCGFVFLKLLIDRCKIQKPEQIEDLLGIEVLVHFKE